MPSDSLRERVRRVRRGLAQLRELLAEAWTEGKGIVRKYRNIPVELDGYRFASKREAGRYQELRMLERAGIIRKLELQKPFELRVNGVLVCKYVCDFAYEDRDGREVVEDVKGVRTRDYAIKAKLMIAVHGLRVVEI